MVKTVPLLKDALRRVSALFSTITSAISSPQPSSTSKSPPPQAAKKRKMIAKKDMRMLIRRKLQRRMNQCLSIASSGQDQASFQHGQALGMQSGESSLDARSVNKKFTAYLATNEEELICSVCRSIMLLPAATTCDHVFCLECIENSLIVNNRCPLCRATVATEDNYGISTLKPIQTLILIRNSRQDSQEHRKRQNQHEKWQKERFIQENQLIPGCKIDLWKTDVREWKCGEVITRDEDSMLVSYTNLPKEQNQVVELPSLRVARLGFYSSRYQAEDFIFPDLHFNFRHSIRIGMEMEPHNPFRRLNRISENPFRLPFLRRPVTLPLQPFNMPSNITQTISIRADSANSNPGHTNIFPGRRDPPEAPQTLSLETDPPELDRLQILGPEVWQPQEEPEQPEADRDVSQLLPNLNPEFRRQAESSSQEEGQQLLHLI